MAIVFHTPPHPPPLVQSAGAAVEVGSDRDRSVSEEARSEAVALCTGLHGRSRAVLAATSASVLFVKIPRRTARRVARFPIDQVFAVQEYEEPLGAPLVEVSLFTAKATITLTEVARLRALEFCRTVRQAIRSEAAARRPPKAQRGRMNVPPRRSASAC